MTYAKRIGVPATRRQAPSLSVALSLSLTLALVLPWISGCSDGAVSFHSPAATRAALAGVQIDARSLVLSAGADDANAVAVTAALQRMGAPFDLVDVSTASLTAALLADGSHGHYQAIFLARGDLGAGSATGSSALSTQEWQTLTDYEAAFGVRRVSLYTFPDAGYGYAAAFDTVETIATPLSAGCTTSGAAIFRRVSCASGVQLARPTVHAATAIDGATVPLLADGGGRIVAATRAYPDGREALTLNFNQEDGALPTMQLLPDVIAWATRGLYLGERHTYVGAQIDDLFLASALYLGGTYRMTDGDMQALYDWQQRWRQQPNQADFRFDWCINSQGSAPTDPLTKKAQAINAGFKWISHTYDHAEMDAMSYADAYDELNVNNQRITALGLTPFSTANLVTPGITGLHNLDVMAAAYATGVRYLISDSSIAGSDNPSFNAGLPDFVDPRLFLIPRRATDVDYDASLPNEALAYFNAMVGVATTWEQLVDYESDILLGYMLRGENDPWMFHQANTRQHTAGASLLSDLLDATFKKYNALLLFPVVSPTMDQLGGAVAARTSYAAAHVSGLIEPGVAITVQSDIATVVPITGACVDGAESYAGDHIAHVALAAGGSARVNLAACGSANDGGASTDGATGDDGAGVIAGTGGVIAGGTGGAKGTGGKTGTGGARGTGGVVASGSGGSSGAGGAATAQGTGGATIADAATTDTGTPIIPTTPAGCSCTTAPSSSPTSAALGLLLPLAVAFARRRRREA